MKKQKSNFWEFVTLIANCAIIAASLGIVWSLFYTPVSIMASLTNTSDKIFFAGVIIAVIKTAVDLISWAFNNLTESDKQ